MALRLRMSILLAALEKLLGPTSHTVIAVGRTNGLLHYPMISLSPSS
jgi:hypothetical protein